MSEAEPTVVSDQPSEAVVEASEPPLDAEVPTSLYKREEKPYDSMTEDEKQANIIRQMEYYFSDQNLLTDRFLGTQIRENDGWVPLELLLTFKLLKAMNASVGEIEESLKKSHSGLLELCEEGKVRRRITDNPICSDRNRVAGLKVGRTMFVDGFPKSATEREIKEFFVKTAHTDDVQLRCDANKLFMGSVFVAFVTTAAKDWFAGMKADLKFQDQSLEVKTVEEFFTDRGNVSKKDRMLEKVFTKHGGQHKDGDQNCETHHEARAILPGSVIYLADLPETCTREILKGKFSDTHRVFADFDRGDKQAWLRLSEANSAQAAIDAVMEKQGGGDELVFNDEIKVKTFRVIEGEEEKVYWAGVEKKKQEYFKNCKKNRMGRKRRGGAGGFFEGKRKRRNDDGDDARSE